MEQQEQKQPPRSRARKRTGFKTFLLIFLCIAIAGGLGFWYFSSPSSSTKALQEKSSPAETDATADKTSDGSNPALQVSPDNQGTDKDAGATIDIDKMTVEQAPSPEDREKDAQTGGGCEKECGRIELFYSQLDKQAYVQAYKLSLPSDEHFRNLIIKLSQNPPVITRETDDLFTILKNTAHFFRIIGKNNIQLIKGILDQEKDSIEEILADYYAISNDPECLKNSMGIELPEKALYNYAGFFLNTMGGRLYLFRRDSFSRLPVSYYSILIIDRANRQGKNSDGIDIRPSITALISEIENTGNRLRLKETYLETLYELKERYPLEATQ